VHEVAGRAEPGLRPGRALAQAASRLHGTAWIPVDAAAVFGCVLAAHALSPVYLASPLGGEALTVAAVHAASFVLAGLAAGLYDWTLLSLSRWTETAARAAAAALLSGLVTLTAFYLVLYQPIGRRVLGLSAVLSALAVASLRYGLFRVLPPRRVLFARDTALGREIRARLAAEYPAAYETLLPGAPGAAGRPAGAEPSLPDLVERCRAERADEVVLPAEPAPAEPAAAIGCLPLGCRVRTEPAFYEDVFRAVPVLHVSPAWMLASGHDAADHLAEAVRRALDVALSLLLLGVAAVPCLLAMALVWIEDRGPVLFGQVREGRWGRPFRMWKIRSMRPGAERDGARWTDEGDPRRTRVGRLLRRLRLDEVPQLVNVLRGEMSFVGPRPERPEIAAELERAVPLYAWRRLARPGLTGWAQVHLPYGASVEDSRRKLEMDLYYLRHRSLAMDLGIVLRTLTAVTRGSR